MEHPIGVSRESEIIQRAAAAFIQDRHRLGGFVTGLLRDPHAAEDVVQEVWVRLAAEVADASAKVTEPFRRHDLDIRRNLTQEQSEVMRQTNQERLRQRKHKQP